MKKDRVFDVLGGPGRWIAGETALEAAPGALSKIPQPLIVVGEFFLLQKVQTRFIDPLSASGYDLKSAEFPPNGECCESNIIALVETAKEAGCLIAVGGGKCIDTVKIVGQRLGLPVVTVPTSAATCACATNVAVIYDEQGIYLDTLEMDESPRLVFLDTTLLSGQERYLAAGAVDAAAKWLEWSVLPQASRDIFGAEAGVALAEKTWEMLQHSATDAATCKANFEIVLEASMLLSSQASCLGSAPAAIAHSVCNALSLLKWARGILHGELVAYGLLIQDSILIKRGIAPVGHAQREAWLRALAVPVKFPEKLDEATIEKIVAKALAPGESALALIPPVSNEELSVALRELNPK